MELQMGARQFPGPLLDVAWQLVAAGDLGGSLPMAMFQARTRR